MPEKNRNARIIILLFLITAFSGIANAGQFPVIEFISMPDSIQTNIPAFPVTGRMPSGSQAFVNNEPACEAPGQANPAIDFFYVASLAQGNNTITLRIVKQDGTEKNYSKQINYNPAYSTANREIVYASATYYTDCSGTAENGIMAIDLRANAFLGMLRNKTIYGITQDGSELIIREGTNYGRRYSTASHAFTGQTLPDFYASEYASTMLSSDGQFLYHGDAKYSLATNTKTAVLPELVWSKAGITADGSKIITWDGYIENETNTLVPRYFAAGMAQFPADFKPSPDGNHVLHTSYGNGAGILNILDFATAGVQKTVSTGDYAGQIIFSKDGTRSYVAAYGNTWYGNGEISIINMQTLQKTGSFPMMGSRSLAIGRDGKIFSSAFYTYNSGKYLGNPEMRGIVKLSPGAGQNSLSAEKVFFASLTGTMNEPYYDIDKIFYKKGPVISCKAGSDCGKNGLFASKFCSNGNVYGFYQLASCTKPGTPNAACNYKNIPMMAEKCVYGCENSECKQQPAGQKQQSTGAVQLIGKKLFVEGTEYKIKSIGYGPVPIGNTPDAGYDVTVHPELRARDFPLLRAMNANTIRSWAKVGQEGFLDDAWNNGIKPIRVIMGYWMGSEKDYTNSSVRQAILADFNAYVQAYRNKPAVLVWAIGNEENYFYAGGNKQKKAAYFSLVNEMARNAYIIEGSNWHPVMAVSLEFPGTVETVGDLEGGADDYSLNFVDIWGINHYPGNTFGNWFSLYSQKTIKPLVITEYGIDALDNTTMNEYEAAQAEWNTALWREISACTVCLGGSIMEYSDEWWKAGGSIFAHDYGGYPTGSHPDGFSNEEWWGIVRIADNGSNPDTVVPRQAYYALQQEFA